MNRLTQLCVCLILGVALLVVGSQSAAANHYCGYSYGYCYPSYSYSCYPTYCYPSYCAPSYCYPTYCYPTYSYGCRPRCW